MKIFVAGHNGMVGSAILRLLEKNQALGENVEILTRSRSELDLTEQISVREFMKQESPDVVIIAAAKVGGILANNSYPAEFIYQNLLIESNLIHESYVSGVKKLLFLGSSCIYPKLSNQPMAESALLSGQLEATNEPYAIAKIAGIKLCESYNRQYKVDYRSVMPTNLYGPNDNFDVSTSHVIPALIRRFHEAKLLDSKALLVWGSGTPFREFLHVDDLAAATLFILGLDSEIYNLNTRPMLSHINVGGGQEVSIGDLAKLIKKIVGYSGDIEFDKTKPDGTARKLMDSSRINSMGWEASIDIEDGIVATYDWFVNSNKIRSLS